MTQVQGTDGAVREAIVRLLAAMDDAEFAKLVVDARGLTDQQVADLVDTTIWRNTQDITDQHTAKAAAAQALRKRQGV